MVALCYIACAVTVYTVGHSTLPIDVFLRLLDEHGIRGLADVRRFPASRRHPHFAGKALSATLAQGGIAYEWLPELGGRRAARPDSPHTGWRVEAFRGYADHLETPEFASGIGRLVDFAGARTTAVMCAEAVPWRCHRQILSDALVVRGVAVRHIYSGSVAPHRPTSFARLDGERLVYDRGEQGRLPGI